MRCATSKVRSTYMHVQTDYLLNFWCNLEAYCHCFVRFYFDRHACTTIRSLFNFRASFWATAETQCGKTCTYCCNLLTSVFFFLPGLAVFWFCLIWMIEGMIAGSNCWNVVWKTCTCNGIIELLLSHRNCISAFLSSWNKDLKQGFCTW